MITSLARNNASLPVVTIRTQELSTINNSNTLQYTVKDFIKDKHDFECTCRRGNVMTSRQKAILPKSDIFPLPSTPENAFGRFQPATRLQVQVSTTKSCFRYCPASTGYFHLFGRMNYAYKKKILATVSVRSDRSTKFSYENGSLVFPSGTIAWSFGQEKFMESHSFYKRCQNTGWIWCCR